MKCTMLYNQYFILVVTIFVHIFSLFVYVYIYIYFVSQHNDMLTAHDVTPTYVELSAGDTHTGTVNISLVQTKVEIISFNL